MGERMDAGIVKKGLGRLCEHIPLTYPAVVGCIDPAVRQYLPDNLLSFSVSAERFVEMADCIPGSFLEKPD